MKKLYSVVILLLIVSGVAAQNVMTPELLWKLERIGEIAVSPDGKEVIYTLTKYDLEANKGTSDIYKMNVQGGNPRQLTSLEGSETNIAWRPDGQKIAFLATVEGEAQLFEMNPDGSGIAKVSGAELDISHFSYAPDMKHVYYTKDVKTEKTVNELYPDLPKANARIIDDLMYRHWDQWQDYKNSHLFVATYENGKIGTAKDIMEREPYDTPLKPFGGADEIAWSSDGKYIAYTSKKYQGKDYALNTNSDIYLYEVATGNTTNISEGMQGYDKNPTFSPDGKYLAWNSMERSGFEADRERIFLYDMSKGKKSELTKGLDRDASHVIWSGDGSKIYFISGENATAQIFEIDVKKGKVEQITKGHHNYTWIQRADDRTLIGARMSMSSPIELFRIDTKDKIDLPLTQVNKKYLDQITLGKVEERWMKTTDGKDMLVWVIYPPNFDPSKKYPTLLYCQGGPQSAVSQFFSYRWNFQLMAANGYVVVAPNRRGVPSFGQEWEDAISGDWGGQAMKDYLTAIDEVSEEPWVDKENRGAVGASFGGYSVYWLAGNHDNRFSTFISHCGVFNLESMYGTTEEMFFVNWDLGGPYWKSELQDEYKKFSPHNYVQNWDTPILVIHGEKDFRVPIGEGMQAFQAAQLQDIPSRFLYFPEEGHWVLKPQNGVLWHRVYFEWLDKWLKN